MASKAKHILVTGGAGFLGSHLCKKLLAQGNRVTCLDNYFTGKEDNLKPVIGHPQFTFKKHDVCLPFDEEVEEIYHLACPASPIHYQRNPLQTLKTSVLGAIHVLDVALKNRAKIFLASTSEVYGDPHIHPQKEEYWGHVNPIGIRACYDEGKRCAETLFFDTYRMHQLPIKVGRIFNTYGPNMDPRDGRVVSNFIVQAIKNDSITIYGDGRQTRSFCYVDDLINGILALMQTQDEFTGPVNLGNPDEFQVVELAHLVLEMTGSKSKLVFHPLPHDDPKQRRPDISLARNHLNWQPSISLREGLNRTISYFESFL